MTFKYKNDRFKNILSLLLFIILTLLIILIIKLVDNIIYKVIYTLISFIIIYLLINFLSRMISNINGKFTFDKHSFIYDTLSSEYTINYKEIEYISKSTYLDNDYFIKRENYLYKIKIKDAGYFVFKYIDDSLVDAIQELSKQSNIDIIE